MKKSIYSILTTLVLLFMVTSCEKKDTDNGQIEGKLISNSVCKDLKSSNFTTVTPDSISLVEYTFDAVRNLLTLKHINAGFNCCPDSLYCAITVIGNTILIEEFEKAALCHCNCLYDLEIEINGVEAKKYELKFTEPYIGDQEEIIFEINLGNAITGSHEVNRKQYPWGMSIIN